MIANEVSRISPLNTDVSMALNNNQTNSNLIPVIITVACALVIGIIVLQFTQEKMRRSLIQYSNQ